MIRFILLTVFVILSTSHAFKIMSDVDYVAMEHWAAYDRVGRYLGRQKVMITDSMGWLPNSNKIGLGYNPVR